MPTGEGPEEQEIRFKCRTLDPRLRDSNSMGRNLHGLSWEG